MEWPLEGDLLKCRSGCLTCGSLVFSQEIISLGLFPSMLFNAVPLNDASLAPQEFSGYFQGAFVAKNLWHSWTSPSCKPPRRVYPTVSLTCMWGSGIWKGSFPIRRSQLLLSLGASFFHCERGVNRHLRVVPVSRRKYVIGPEGLALARLPARVTRVGSPAADQV